MADTLPSGPEVVVRQIHPLDLQANPGGFKLWKSKARAYLTGQSPAAGKAFDWAARQIEPITLERQGEAAHLVPELDIAEVSAVVFTAVQETISDRLRMTLPDLAGDGLGLEIWRLIIREHEAPEQPGVQREFQKRWAYPKRCKDASELQARLPQWEVWGRELEVMRGRSLEEDAMTL